MIRAIVAAIALSATMPAAHAGRVDIPADGVYSQQCLPGVTCFVSLEKRGKTWHAEFWADDNKPGGKRLCEFVSTLKVGVGTFADGSEFDALVGKVGPQAEDEVYVAGQGMGEVRVVERATLCVKSKLPRNRGILGFSGGYDPEGDF